MEELIFKLRERLTLLNDQNKLINNQEILAFENRYKKSIPNDLKLYFSVINGTYGGEYDDYFFTFYPFSKFETVNEKFKSFNGVPNYTNLINTLIDPQSCFVFCDYEFHLFSYAIRLYEDQSKNNEIYALCGAEYKIIGNSFTEFLKLYFMNSDDLRF